ncbi:MAG: hypothetical protein WC551_11335 [Patescibacteria group bacterium]
MASTWGDFFRDPIWLLKVTLDQCDNTFGDAPCTAVGKPCYYSYPTCKDQNNFVKTTRVLYFSSVQGPYVSVALPLIDGDPEVNETKLDPINTLTTVGQFRVSLRDTPYLPWANPDKTPDPTKNTFETDGTFLKNLFIRNSNWRGRPVELFLGLRGQAVANYKRLFSGYLDNIEYLEGTVRLTVKDALKKLDVKLPPSISSTNLLTQAYNNGATMYVTDGTEFMDPAVYGGKKMTAKIEDEYVTYTGVSGDTLTGCVGGAWGTTAVNHAIGTAVKNVCIVADPDEAAASWDAVDGMGPDWCILNLLYALGKIDFSFASTVDYSVLLDGGVSDSDLTFVITDGSNFPASGCAKIGDEAVWFSRSDETLTIPAWGRGMFGTAAAAHLDEAPVLVVDASDEAGLWYASSLFRRRWEDSTNLVEIVKELREAGKIRVWQGEDSKLHIKMAPGLSPLDDPVRLDEKTAICQNPGPELDHQEDERTTRVSTLYDPNVVKPAKDSADWDGVLVQANVDLEGTNYLDAAYEALFWCPWIYRQAEALLLSQYHLLWFQYGPKKLTFDLDGAQAQYVDVGDFVRCTTAVVPNIDGAPRLDVLYEITRKKKVGIARWRFEALDLSGSVDQIRYAVISPSSLTEDYDDVGSYAQALYGWVGNADNEVGTANDMGYSIL